MLYFKLEVVFSVTGIRRVNARFLFLNDVSVRGNGSLHGKTYVKYPACELFLSDSRGRYFRTQFRAAMRGGRTS